VTSTSPIPFAAAAEENIDAQGSFDLQFEFAQPAGIASFLHFVPIGSRGNNIPYISLDKVAKNSALFFVLASLSRILCVASP
jgi:hypothetical protein